MQERGVEMWEATEEDEEEEVGGGGGGEGRGGVGGRLLRCSGWKCSISQKIRRWVGGWVGG